MKMVSDYLLRIQQENQTFSLQGASHLRRLAAFVYKLLGRNIVGRLLITSDKCKKCKYCVALCPHQAIAFHLGHPRRNRKCKGCFQCLSCCPQQAIVMPVGQVVLALMLLFLPYDEWINRLFSLNIDLKAMNLQSIALSLALWSLGYVVAFVVVDKCAFLVQLFMPVNKLGEKAQLQRIRDEINPLFIFPVIRRLRGD